VFLRTTEFLWQEGHTAHETADEAVAEARMILLDVYRRAAEEVLALPVRVGRKSESERFAGAVETLTMEALMRDRKALQAGTSHYLGQNFSKAYGVKFLGRDNEEHFAEATSWGVSTRLVGGVIMTHGDDKGLRLPPSLAPHEVVIVPIYKSDDERSLVMDAVKALVGALQGRRVKVDDREGYRPGFKYNEWELKGVPVRIEIGPKDIAQGHAMIARRDTGEKEPVPEPGIPMRVGELLEEIQARLLADASSFRDEHTFTPKDYDEFKGLITDPGGFLQGGWCGRRECEDKVKADTKATIRYLPLDPEPAEGACLVCGEAATERATWAVAY
jgi:prolyl-tRNA synthetase